MSIATLPRRVCEREQPRRVAFACLAERACSAAAGRGYPMSSSISDGAERTTAYVSPRAVAGGSWSAVESGAMYAEKDKGLFGPSVHRRKRLPPLGTVNFTCGHQRSSEVIRGHQRSSEVIKRSSEVIRGHQRSSEVIRGHPRSSEVIRGNQRSSEVIRGHQRPSEVIRGHPRSSEVIRGHQGPSELEGRSHNYHVLSGHQSHSEHIRARSGGTTVCALHTSCMPPAGTLVLVRF